MTIDIDTILRRCWQKAADEGVREGGAFVLSPMAEYFITKDADHPLGSCLYGHDVEVDPDLDGFVAYIKAR